MADIFLGPIVEALLKKLVSIPVQYVRGLWKVAAQLEKMTVMLLKIQAALDDAEAKQISNAAVKTWLNELKYVAYDLEDLVDEFETESHRLGAEAEGRTVTTKEMATELKRINETLERIAKERDTYGLREGVGVGIVNRGRPTSSLDDKSPTSSLEDKSRVIGRAKDKDKLIQQLLQSDDEGSADEIRVIPIVGMAGVGKTTLARMLYNDKAIDKHFNLKAWAYVSQEFDLVNVTQAILESFTANRPQSHESAPTHQHLDPLQVKLKEKVSANKFLLVLDDVWHIKVSDWVDLLKPLSVGAAGSKILVTTRNAKFLATPTEEAYPLKQLGSEDGWSLFSDHAFASGKRIPKLEPIGRQIVDKCQGLPLAVITLGRLLHSNVDVKDWEHVLNSEIWDLPVDRSDILPALRLSYYHLPAHLKPCFAFCAIFPKGYKFRSGYLRSLWMAEGLVRPEQNKRVEDISEEYFLDLLSRSFFQDISSEGIPDLYILHDLLVDLAKFISGEMSCYDLKPNQVITNCRHMSYIQKFSYIRPKFDVVHNAKRLRTLISPYKKHIGTCYIARQVPSDLVASLKYLRVLDLSDYSISELPDSIGNMKHLRYLDLARTAIKRLPDSICTLYNLQYLGLEGCVFLTELPKDIANLTNLRALVNSGCRNLKQMPTGISRWRNLRLLFSFVVGDDGGSSIKELKDMDLEEGIELSKLENIADIQDAREANLRNKLHLRCLHLRWSSDKNESEDSSRDGKDVLDSLEPHKKLELLRIEHYCGKEFPKWVGHSSFLALHTLRLFNCTECKSLPPLGQLPSLKELVIGGFYGVKRVGLEFYGVDCPKPFSSLQKLTFIGMPEWEEWSGTKEKLPCLRKLWLQRCPKLRKSSQWFPASLDELKIIDCGELTEFPWLSSLLPQDLLNNKREASLVISNCPKLTALPRQLPWVNKVRLFNCNEMVLETEVEISSVTSFHISRIPLVRYLPLWFVQCSRALSKLEIVRCDYLIALFRGGLQHLTSLQVLKISGCPQLMRLSEEEEYLPPKLRELEIEDCAKLEKLPNELRNLGFLNKLVIKNCQAFISFPEELLHDNSPLEHLELVKCSSLTAITRNVPLTHLLNIEHLAIKDCENLECLPQGLNNLTHLKELYIMDCPRIVSFPEGGLPTTSLRHLHIVSCENLNSFPNGLHNCTSLVSLIIASCPASFPEQWLPPNLRALTLADCPNIELLSNLGSQLYELASLGSLMIGGFPYVQSFPENMFPTTLRVLRIISFQNLTRLPKGLHNLATLECLIIEACPKLACLPKKGLPTSKLGALGIFDCPKLKLRCEGEKGKDSSKIAHVPLVGIDDMQDPIQDYFVRKKNRLL